MDSKSEWLIKNIKFCPPIYEVTSREKKAKDLKKALEHLPEKDTSESVYKFLENCNGLYKYEAIRILTWLGYRAISEIILNPSEAGSSDWYGGNYAHIFRSKLGLNDFRDGISSLTVGLEKKDEHEQKNQHYKYIPSGIGEFLHGLSSLKDRFCVYNEAKNSYGKFIDIGSGLGEKTLLASLLLFDSHGLEYNKETYMLSDLIKNRLLSIFNIGKANIEEDSYKIFCNKKESVSRSKFFRGDAFKRNFYHHYKIIYMYTPISNPMRLVNLHRKIIDHMSVGSILWDIGGLSYKSIDKIRYNLYDYKHKDNYPIIPGCYIYKKTWNSLVYIG